MERIVRQPNLLSFNCAILLNKRKVQTRNWRIYLVENWKTLTKDLKEATVLVLAGRHGEEDGTISPFQGDEKAVFDQHKKMVCNLKHIMNIQSILK